MLNSIRVIGFSVVEVMVVVVVDVVVIIVVVVVAAAVVIVIVTVVSAVIIFAFVVNLVTATNTFINHKTTGAVHDRNNV